MAELGTDILENDDEFIRLFSKSQRALHAFIVGMTFSSADADDVLQEVNLALWKKRRAYDPQYDFIRWAIGFAKVEIANHGRKRGKSRLLFSDDVLNLLANDWPVEATYHEQRLTALTLCIKKLGAPESRFVAEFYRGGSTVKEMSEMHEAPISSVYKVLNRARKSLRLCIQNRIAQSSHPA
jgi:RNA polymerase sigma-70 factor (ECF subfamily)